MSDSRLATTPSTRPTTTQGGLGKTNPLQSQERIIQLVLDSLSSPASKRAYAKALRDFLAWFDTFPHPEGFSRACVQSYRAFLLEAGLSSGTINLRLSAIRRLAQEAQDNEIMPSGQAQGIVKIKGVKQHGTRTGNWLNAEQAEKLLNMPSGETLRGRRDRAILAVLLGCGLRREEAAALTMGHLQQREGRWVIVDLVGKGNRTRTVPMPSWCKAAIDLWIEGGDANCTASNAGETMTPTGVSNPRASEAAPVASRAGAAFRSDTPVFTRLDVEPAASRYPTNRNGPSPDLPQHMTPQAIFDVVVKYARKAGLPAVAPHDLRRTFAKLAHKGRAQLEQIQLSLGHASITTTERYLGVRQDLTDAPCDRLGIKL